MLFYVSNDAMSELLQSSFNNFGTPAKGNQWIELKKEKERMKEEKDKKKKKKRKLRATEPTIRGPEK